MIKDNLSRVRHEIISACSKVNQDPAKVKIVAVSKGRKLEEIEDVLSCGIFDIGESRVQEALTKHQHFTKKSPAYPITWHLIGHLQKNKAKDAVRIFDLIHSIDSLALAEKVDKEAERINKIQRVLIEIKTSSEETKFGFSLEEARNKIRQILEFKNLKVEGLMTIAPFSSSAQATRNSFKALRELQERIDFCNLPILSMGMSDDFQIAIEEGANLVRIGRAIFNP
ncbi:MAG: YggS family pyridoxal phosphate-dependent enzyme [Candidatus Omnitrophota bacterium]